MWIADGDTCSLWDLFNNPNHNPKTNPKPNTDFNPRAYNMRSRKLTSLPRCITTATTIALCYVVNIL